MEQVFFNVPLTRLEPIFKGWVKDVLNDSPLLKSRQFKEDPNALLTRKQIKERYNISYPTIHKLMQSGEFPYIKEGRKTLFKKGDVDSYFENKKTVL